MTKHENAAEWLKAVMRTPALAPVFMIIFAGILTGLSFVVFHTVEYFQYRPDYSRIKSDIGVGFMEKYDTKLTIKDSKRHSEDDIKAAFEAGKDALYKNGRFYVLSMVYSDEFDSSWSTQSDTISFEATIYLGRNLDGRGTPWGNDYSKVGGFMIKMKPGKDTDEWELSDCGW